MSAAHPRRGEVWSHRTTGGFYAVVGRATNKDPDGEIDGLVVYRELGSGNGAYFVRTRINFLERFTYESGPFRLQRAEAVSQ